MDGGLLILSRYPIVERDQLSFSLGSGSDGVCAKGAIYARVQLSPDLADSLHVFTTHTQASDSFSGSEIRANQLAELLAFIERSTRDDPASPVLIGGDFNMDARHDLSHENGQVHSTPCKQSRVYEQFMSGLSRALPGRAVVDLLKTHGRDPTQSGANIHPITNGDGHAALVHTRDPADLTKDGKCIDYLFFRPGEDAAEDTSAFSLELVPSKTRVDYCQVADIVPVRNGGRLPVTHLSDHYGLRAEFTVQTSEEVTRPDGSPLDSGAMLADALQLYFPPHAFAQTPRRLWRLKLLLALLAIAATSSAAVVIVMQTLYTALRR